MFLTKPKISSITQPILDRVMTHSLGDDIVLEGHSLQLMYDIQNEPSIFEPIEDDEARLIWLEIPRGTARGNGNLHTMKTRSQPQRTNRHFVKNPLAKPNGFSSPPVPIATSLIYASLTVNSTEPRSQPHAP